MQQPSVNATIDLDVSLCFAIPLYGNVNPNSLKKVIEHNVNLNFHQISFWYEPQHSELSTSIANKFANVDAIPYLREISSCHGENGVMNSKKVVMNQCLDRATAEWLCVIDFDELIIPKLDLGSFFGGLADVDQVLIDRETFVSDVCTSIDREFPDFNVMVYSVKDEDRLRVKNKFKSCFRVSKSGEYKGHKMVFQGETVKIPAKDERIRIKHYREITATEMCRVESNRKEFQYQRNFSDPCNKKTFEQKLWVVRDIMDETFASIHNWQASIKATKPLKFIHITKTGGTSIEFLSKGSGYDWGKLHKEYGWRHKPFSLQPESLKSKYDWFMVVRNPYDRILSEFHCKWGGIGTEIGKYDVSQFNSYVRNKIKHREVKYQRGGYRGHYLEQWKYLDVSQTIHLIPFETLKGGFDDLMIKYGIELRMDIHINANVRKFTKYDFEEETLLLINEVYEKDFRLFGYEAMQFNLGYRMSLTLPEFKL